MDIELAKALLSQGGGVAVCMLLVRWFLSFLKESQEAHAQKIDGVISSMADKFTSELASARAAFTTQVTELTSQTFNQSMANNAAMMKLSSAIDELRQRIEKS